MNSSDLKVNWATRRVEMKLAPDFKRRGARLLHQQCGLWGYDVRREVSGVRCNVLLELGFTRTPPPTGVLGATTYARCETSGKTVTLWGFGMHFGDENGGIFLSRFAFWPRYSALPAPEPVWMPSQMKETHHAPRRLSECWAALDYFQAALGWIANYEREIQARFGPQYRADALQLWRKAEAELEAVHIARDWDELAAQFEANAWFTYCWHGQNRQMSHQELKRVALQPTEIHPSQGSTANDLQNRNHSSAKITLENATNVAFSA